MADDTTAAMIAQLDVKFDKLASNMKKAMTVFDNGGRALEKRQAQIKKNLSNWAIDFSGLSGINKALVGLSAAGIVTGLGAIVTKSLEAASAIGDTATQAGVGVEFLQKLRFAASQTGASFGVMDTALTTLNKTFGDYLNTGAGKGAATFKALGIDKLINAGDIRNTEQLFDVLVKKISGVGSESQKSALLASMFGKQAGPQLLQLINQGAQGVADLEAKAVSLGIVLSADTVNGAKEANDKLSALFSVIKAEGVSAVSRLAPEIGALAQKITDGFPDLVTWAEKWAAWFGLIDLSTVEKLKAEIQDIEASINRLNASKGGFFANPFGLNSASFDAAISASQKRLADLQQQLAATSGAATPELQALNAQIVDLQQQIAKGGHAGLFVSAKNDTEQLSKQLDVLLRKRTALMAGQPSESVTVTASRPALHVPQTAADKALADRRKELLAQTGVDAATASAALIVAQDTTNVQLLKGSADYYAAVKKQIADEYQASVTTAEAEADKQKATLGKKGTDWKGYADGVANINQALADKIATAGEKQKQALDASGPSGFIRDALIMGDQQITQYKDETAALGLVAGAAAKLAYVQGQLNDAKERGIPLTDKELAQIEAEGDAIGRAAQASHEAAVKSQDNIQTLDTLRSGLSDVGTTGITRFKDLGSAAASFGQQLAEVIAQLYVMKPILNGLFGESGTPGSGILGGFLGSLFGGSDLAANTSAAIAANPLLFKNGGIARNGQSVSLPMMANGGVSRRPAVISEFGQPEAAVPLPDGHRIPVDLRMPAVPSITPGTSPAPIIVQHFDLSGAVVTDEIMARAKAAGDSAATSRLQQYNTHVLPGRIRQLATDPYRSY